ncbi:uncharacterized protein LOC125051970 isoform X1 [Pieris napi]|uniref:uncharacterized protein LOC125051970 isoform X1 n=1 Tax=Pieris napi TaxID=78633 RepID=UPI001FBA3AD2|nr:uncharacterized protein LOC125051970 isoform X1 [Pieris napi]XP_047508568.1 uncharacterized protein LOC125051970 isoform X1 [Pieris napi]
MISWFLKMRCELPILMRCCFCVPLRLGLLIWTYLKLILSLFILTVFCIQAELVARMSNRHVPDGEKSFLVAMIMFGTINSLFQIAFIVAAHKKNYKIMRIYYIYNFVYIFIPTILFIMFCIIVYSRLGGFMIMLLSAMPFVIIIISIPIEFVLNIYLMLLVRSEFIKLRDSGQFEFFNHESEARCVATLPDNTIPQEGECLD